MSFAHAVAIGACFAYFPHLLHSLLYNCLLCHPFLKFLLLTIILIRMFAVCTLSLHSGNFRHQMFILQEHTNIVVRFRRAVSCVENRANLRFPEGYVDSNATIGAH